MLNKPEYAPLSGYTTDYKKKSHRLISPIRHYIRTNIDRASISFREYIH